MTQTPKERLKEAGESGKNAIKNIVSVVTNAVAGIKNTIKSGCQAIDAGDLAIGNAIEKKLKEKGKNTTRKLGKLARENILKLLIILSAGGGTIYGVNKASDNIKEKKEDKVELVVNDENTYIKEIFENKNILEDIQGDGKAWQDKRKNNYLGNNEFWNENHDGLNQRKDVIGGFCRMIESGDIDMIFEKADSAGVPRQCIYLALTESARQAGANSGVAGGYRQFTKGTAKLYGLIDNNGNDYRSDNEKSTEAAMRHLKDNYNTVGNYASKLGYDLSESDKWIFAFYMFNGSPGLVKAGMSACEGNVDKYPDALIKLAKKNGGYINGKKVKARENANYVPRILGIQDALEEIFKDNDYDIQKVKISANILTHVKTTADSLYEEYQKESPSLNTQNKISRLEGIKGQYKNEYDNKLISKSYYEGAIRAIDEVIQSLGNSD